MIEAYIIFVVCMLGCAFTAWSLGRQEGISNAIDYLIEQGTIEVEDVNE